MGVYTSEIFYSYDFLGVPVIVANMQQQKKKPCIYIMYNITPSQKKVLFPLVHFVFLNSLNYLKYILIAGGNDSKPM